MNTHEYLFESESLYFKHELSVNLPRDAYSMHVHDLYEVFYFVDGNATFVIENQAFKLKPGDLILIRPLKYHFIKIDSVCEYERYSILFDEKILHVESHTRVSPDVCVINLETTPLARDLFPKISYYYAHFETPEFIKLTSALLNELFYLISMTPQHTVENIQPGMSPWLLKALQYINDNLGNISDVTEVAGKCFVSESYLCHLFNRELHQTPKKYINNKRMLMAQRLLSAGEKSKDVCEKCGFKDYTTFYRNYISYFGHSPSVEKETDSYNRISHPGGERGG